MRAAIHLLHFSAPNVRDRNNSTKSLPADWGDDQDLVKLVWQSLRLLKGVPSEVTCNISDRLGAGLLTFIRLV